MANAQETKKLQRIEQLAKGYYGAYLIDWLEEIKHTYSDVRNAKKLGMSLDTACAVAGIIEEEMIDPLKQFRQKKLQIEKSGNDME